MENNCNLCPHKCNVDRVNKFGVCGAGNKIQIGGYSLHKFEEPCISGDRGSRNCVFFKM